MSTEPKPESPAELAAEAKRLTETRPCYSGAAILCMFECEGCVKVREAHAIIDRLAALATIQASASASQEPVAWVNLLPGWSDGLRRVFTDAKAAADYHKHCYDLTPLYTAATQARPASEELPPLPRRDESSERRNLWRLVNDWHDAEPGVGSAKAADLFEDEVDALLSAYAREAVRAALSKPTGQSADPYGY